MSKFENLFLLFMSITLIFYPILPSFGIYSVTYAIVLTTLFGLILIFINKENFNGKSYIKFIFSDKIFILLLILNIIMYASSLVAVNKNKTLLTSSQFTLYILFFFVLTHLLFTNKTKIYFKYSIIISNLIISMISLFQFIILKYNQMPVSEDNRVTSTLENSNILGIYGVLFIFIFISLYFISITPKEKLLYVTLIIFNFINIIGSSSRNALIGLVIGILILPVLYKKKYFIFSFLFSLSLILIPQTRSRILDIFDMTQNSSRIKIWKLTFLIIKDNFLTGIGYENYGDLYPIYVANNKHLQVWDGYRAYHPHNLFLKFQVELGLFGLLTFIIFALYTIYICIKKIKVLTTNTQKALTLATTTSFISFLSMNIVDSFFTSPKVLITLLILLSIPNSIINKTT